MARLDGFLNEVLAVDQAAWRRESEAAQAAGERPAVTGRRMDEHAFHVVYGRTAVGLRAYAARVLGNATHADDIVQESYLRLVRAPPDTETPSSCVRGSSASRAA